MKVDVDEFWTTGLTIIPGAYTSGEIKDMREAAESNEHTGDLLSHPTLHHLVTDGRMKEVAQKILGVDEVVYYGDSVIAVRQGTPGWHKDNVDRLDKNGPDWGGRYTQLRFGIYLQDHKKHSGGLNVKLNSHDKPNLKRGRIVQVETAVGDLAVWSMRITHSAAATKLRWPFKPTYPDFKAAEEMPGWKKLPRHPKRVAIFSALGADDHHLERYLTYMKTRSYAVNMWKQSALDDQRRQELAASGVKLRDMHAEIQGTEGLGQNETWVAMPY